MLGDFKSFSSFIVLQSLSLLCKHICINHTFKYFDYLDLPEQIYIFKCKCVVVCKCANPHPYGRICLYIQTKMHIESVPIEKQNRLRKHVGLIPITHAPHASSRGGTASREALKSLY